MQSNFWERWTCASFLSLLNPSPLGKVHKEGWTWCCGTVTSQSFSWYIISVWCSFVHFFFLFSSLTCLHSLIKTKRWPHGGLKWGTTNHTVLSCVRNLPCIDFEYISLTNQFGFLRTCLIISFKRKRRPPKAADPLPCDYNDIATSSGPNMALRSTGHHAWNDFFRSVC